MTPGGGGGGGADSEFVAAVRKPNVHVHFICCFETGKENNSFWSIHAKIHLKRVNQNLSCRAIGAPSTLRFRKASADFEKKVWFSQGVVKTGKLLV